MGTVFILIFRNKFRIRVRSLAQDHKFNMQCGWNANYLIILFYLKVL